MANTYGDALPSEEICPEHVFFGRRRFIKGALSMGVSAVAMSYGKEDPNKEKGDPFAIPFERPDVFPARRNTEYPLPEKQRTELTPRKAAATINNFYEFLPNIGGPVYKFVGRFKVEPWRVEITGLCNKPQTLDLDDLFKFEHEERLYHFRCVERWAMNVPWSGFPLSKLIEKVEPKKNARFVRFYSANRPSEMPGVRGSSDFEWPYNEALRLEEAMNELALAVTGVYGRPLPIQHGSPIRIIVPWKYGYKNPKSVVKIEFTATEPSTFWQKRQPHEYGFLSNVNPYIPHPRWSQRRSVWLGKGNDWFPTRIFNGYEKYVASLYPDEPRKKQRPLRPGQIAR